MEMHGSVLTRRLSAVIIMILLGVSGCATGDSPVPAPAIFNPSEGKLAAFFAMCERDNRNALRVIVERDLIKNLTHLHRMNSGGRRYYLLEREGITEMLRSVTEGVYTDFILINRRGVVIYTMTDDEIFGKNVTTALGWSPLLQCFSMQGQEAHIEDVVMFPPLSSQYSLFVALRVVGEGEDQGVFVLRVNVEKIAALLDNEYAAVSREGTYRVTGQNDKMLMPFPYFDRIETETLLKKGHVSFIADKKKFVCFPFAFKNLFWIIVRER